MKSNKEKAEEIYERILKEMYKKVGKKTTYSDTLHKCGKRLWSTKFKGVYSADTLPSLAKGQLCIANLDKSWESGSHWVGIGKDKSGTTLVYDSFGRDIYQILPELSRFTNVRSTEQDAEQEDEETDCGARCLAFLYILNKYGKKYAQHI